MTPRAKPLPPDERRQTIIDAARPLVAEHGSHVTTAMIAQAAGIAEGTLFRVFATKAEIVVAAIRATLDTSGLAVAITQLTEPTLPARARHILVELQQRWREASTMFAALYGMGKEARDAATPMHDKHDHQRGREATAALRAAVADALRPFEAQLTTTPEKAASFLMGLATISSHGLVSDGSLTDPDELVSLFLHGTASQES